MTPHPVRPTRPWLIGLALGLVWGTGSAAPVYRCGNGYQDTPCPGGSVVETSDARSPAQQAQAQAQAEREREQAEQLRQERLARALPGATATRGSGAAKGGARATAAADAPLEAADPDACAPARRRGKTATRRDRVRLCPGVALAPRPAAKEPNTNAGSGPRPLEPGQP